MRLDVRSKTGDFDYVLDNGDEISGEWKLNHNYEIEMSQVMYWKKKDGEFSIDDMIIAPQPIFVYRQGEVEFYIKRAKDLDKHYVDFCYEHLPAIAKRLFEITDQEPVDNT